jgi:hypothetical protein
VEVGTAGLLKKLDQATQKIVTENFVAVGG